jgi:hypothetical protein
MLFFIARREWIDCRPTVEVVTREAKTFGTEVEARISQDVDGAAASGSPLDPAPASPQLVTELVN